MAAVVVNDICKWFMLKTVIPKPDIDWSFLKRQTSGTSSDNEWQRVVQRVTTSGKTSYNEWQRVTTSQNEWQRVAKSDKEWQRVVQQVTTNDKEWPFRLVFLFLKKIREEPTTKHPKKNSLNIEEDLWRWRPIN